MTKTRQWTAGAALLTALILVAGFMLLVQPQRSEASALAEQTTSQEDAAVALQSKLAQLKAQQKDLPRQQARLAEIRTRLPETPALPSLIRSLSVAADTAGAELVTLAPSAPVDVSGSGPGSATGGVPAGTIRSGATGTSDAPAAAAASTQALKEIPLRLEVTGSYAALTQFLTQIEGLQRSMLVTDVAITKETEAGGDTLTLSLGASVFMTAEQAAAATATVPTPVANGATTTE
jgi:Tfp pilus assembly protein PilO